MLRISGNIGAYRAEDDTPLQRQTESIATCTLLTPLKTMFLSSLQRPLLQLQSAGTL